MFKNKYRIETHNDRIFIQIKKWYSKDWSFFSGDYPTNEYAQSVIDLLTSNPHSKVYVGETTNCVYCGKLLNPQHHVGSGHLKFHNQIQAVGSNFCNEICMRNMYSINNFWNGSYWLGSYGLKFNEPFAF